MGIVPIPFIIKFPLNLTVAAALYPTLSLSNYGIDFGFYFLGVFLLTLIYVITGFTPLFFIVKLPLNLVITIILYYALSLSSHGVDLGSYMLGAILLTLIWILI